VSQHSYSRCWLHIIWSTQKKERLLQKEARKKIHDFLIEYADSKSIYMKLCYINPDHVHAIIDLPTKYSIEDAVKLLKGGSSYWINKNRIVSGKFSWARGYGVFSVSQSTLKNVVEYVNNQEEHHKKKSFLEEYREFIKAYGLKFMDR